MLSVLSNETCNEFAGPVFESLRLGKNSSFRRNIAVVESRWQHSVRIWLARDLNLRPPAPSRPTGNQLDG